MPHKSNHQYEYAGFWVRFAASMIDTTLISIMTMPLLYAYYGMTAFSGGELNVTSKTDGITGQALVNGLSAFTGAQSSGLAGLSSLNNASDFSLVKMFIEWGLPLIATVIFWVYRSATPGKIAFNLKVLDDKTGYPLTFGQSVIRYLGYFVSIIPLGLGIIWVAFDRKHRGFHDLLASTVVVRDRTDSIEKVKFGDN